MSAFSPTVPNGHQSISVQHTERIQINKSLSETSRLYSYMTPLDGLPPPSSSPAFDDTQINNPYMKSPTYLTRQVNPMYSNMNNPWLLSEMSSILRQNNTNNISLSTTAQQILNGNNRPLRSEKIDIEVIKHLIQEANWKRQCGMKKEVSQNKISMFFFFSKQFFRFAFFVEIMVRMNLSIQVIH